MKNAKSLLTLTALLATLGFAQAKGVSVSGDFFTNGKQTKARATLVAPHSKLIGMRLVEGDSLEHTSIKAVGNFNALNTDFFGIVRYDDKRDSKQLHVSPDIGKDIKGFYIYAEPAWMTFDLGKEGKGLVCYAPFAQVNAKKLGLDLQAAGIEVYTKGEPTVNAVYATTKNEKLGLGLSKGYGDDLGAYLGTMTGNFGTFEAISYTPKTKDWKVTSNLAENASGSTTPNGPALWCDYVVIGRGPEDMPYFTGTASKSKSGLAGKVSVSGKGTKVTSATGELGFSAGNGLSFSASETYSFEKGTSTIGTIVTYKAGKVTLEGKASSDKSVSAYVGFN